MSAEERAAPAHDDELPTPAPELVRRWREYVSFPYPSEDEPYAAAPNPAAQAALGLALGHLGAHTPGTALHALAEVDVEGNVLARSTTLVARGLLAEGAGALVAADACFDEAFELGVPSPTILAACGSFFRRRGRLRDAYHCFALLEHVDPNLLDGFLQSLPAEELRRYSPAVVPKLLTPERPLFFNAHPIKRMLVHELGEAAAALVLGELLEQGSHWSAARVELCGLLDYALERGLVYEELARPKPVAMAEPAFVREETGPPIVGTTRTVFFTILPDIVVPSKSNLLITEHRGLVDYQGDELMRVPLWFDLDPAVLSHRRRRLTVLRHDAAGGLPPLDEALSLVGMFTANFAHFIVEKLFKVLACIGRPGFESVPILIDEQMQPAHREMLELFLGPEHPIVAIPAGGSVQVSRLWTVASPVYWPGWEVPGEPSLPHEELVDVAFLDELLGRVEPSLQRHDNVQRPARVFLTRKDFRLANRKEVEKWFEELGWLVVDAADLPFVEQLELVRNAETVVVIDGAAKYGLFFGRPGLRVGLLVSSPNEGPPHEQLQLFGEMLRQRGHHLLALPGKPTEPHPIWDVFTPYRIERDDLVLFLERLESLDVAGE